MAQYWSLRNTRSSLAILKWRYSRVVIPDHLYSIETTHDPSDGEYLSNSQNHSAYFDLQLLPQDLTFFADGGTEEYSMAMRNSKWLHPATVFKESWTANLGRWAKRWMDRIFGKSCLSLALTPVRTEAPFVEILMRCFPKNSSNPTVGTVTRRYCLNQ